MAQNNNNNFLQPLGPLVNACDTSLAENSGTLPTPIDGLRDFFQQITFSVIGKSVNGTFLVQEQATNIVCYGILIPTGRPLAMTRNGQRAWKSYDLYCDLSVILKPDDVLVYLGSQFRCLKVDNYRLFGFMHYWIEGDYSDSGPIPQPL